MAVAEADYETWSLPATLQRSNSAGRSVVLVGAHGGAGTSTAALAIASDADRGVCLIDADLTGGTLGTILGVGHRIGDAGLAAVREGEGTAFLTLAWLIRDGALRELTRQAMRQTSLIVVDAARPVGPSCEPVVDADVIVIVGHTNRFDAIERTQQRLVRLGVDAARIVLCPTAPTIVERTVGRFRGSQTCIDVRHGDELLLLVEGRLAALGPRERG